ncbi:MAG: SpoIIE family protein phosphatase [Anaerolineae bacterium]|nr:SpoIIE family protein phosphatase [Anaerolineae bacterium]
MLLLGELRVQAEHENLRVISAFIHGIAQRLNLSDKCLFEVELAVEEAATNVIAHAYPGEDKGQLLVGATESSGFLTVSLTDWGVPLDPRDVKPFDLNAPIEQRIQGGMGLHFIHTLMDRVTRETARRTGDPNVLHLAKRIERIPDGLTPASAVQELNAMRTVSQMVTANIALDDLLELILNKLLTTINAERGTIFLIDEAQGELWSRVLLDPVGPLSEIRLKMGQGIAGHVAQTGETLNIADAYADPRFIRDFDKITGFRTRSILTAPMLNPQQKIIGVVQLLNKIGGAFTPRDERLLAAMTSQAAISIENARLYQQEMAQQLIQRELDTAHAIQASFLPDELPQHPAWDIAALWQPVRSVAGDFYDFYPLNDGRLGVVMADVSGKGIPAALFMALCVTMLRFGMNLGLPPREAVRLTNERLIADQRSRMFATAFVSYVDLDGGRLEFANAGHNPALVYRAATGAVETLTAQGVALGVFEAAPYQPQIGHLSAGDVLVLYTDGITEAINADEDEFGEDRLRALIAAHAGGSARALADRVIEAVAAFVGDADAYDDATLVVLRRQAAESS